MSLLTAYKATRIIECVNDYAIAAEYPSSELEARSPRDAVWYTDDEEFWIRVRERSILPGSKCHISGACISEWVARVPGLYWSPSAARLRQLSPAAIENQSTDFVTYTPSGKSRKVLGGLGTLRFPPDVQGYRLASFVYGLNASAGVPALVAPDVWEAAGLSEGRMVVDAAGVWQEMESGWASRFPSVRGIPRGYLILNDPDAVHVRDERGPVQIHPFTVMRYDRGPAELFDFVYATADTAILNYRDFLFDFFEDYRTQHGRAGRYLLQADIGDPLWDAEYTRPEDLKRGDPAADSQMRLIELRIHEQMLGRSSLECLIQGLAGMSSPNDLRRISLDAGILPSTWWTGGTVARDAACLVEKAVQIGKLETLIEVVALNTNLV